MQEIIETGRIVDVMVIFVVLEVAALLLYRAVTGRGIPPVALLLNIGAGGSLMLALGATLKNYGWQTIALLLIAALCFHVADLWQRWPRPTPQ